MALAIDTPNAVVWMVGDKLKRLADLNEGDEVVGWRMRKFGEAKLVETKVTYIKHAVEPVVTVRMFTERFLTCTPDQRWANPSYRPSLEDQDEFIIPKADDALMLIFDPRLKEGDQLQPGMAGVDTVVSVDPEVDPEPVVYVTTEAGTIFACGFCCYSGGK